MVSTNTLWDILIVHKTSTNGVDHNSSSSSSGGSTNSVSS